MTIKNEMEKGVQPLDGLMTRLNLKNRDLVEKSCEQLSHKVVAKGRKGRRLTLNADRPGSESFALNDLFNYKGSD